MANCAFCGEVFEQNRPTKIYCSTKCKERTRHIKRHGGPLSRARCANCQSSFQPKRADWICCSPRCSSRLYAIRWRTLKMMERAENGTIDPAKDRSCRGYYSSQEIEALRADPLCILPNRNLAAQWRKCCQLGIPRDRSLRVIYKRSPETEARKSARRSRDRRAPIERRYSFRKQVRANPGPVLDELRRLARGHHHAEDIVDEGFATVLRLAIPAAEAFKIAKAEVNRTSAQPFREQSFNPDIDYAAQETGRQVARASDIRAARGEG